MSWRDLIAAAEAARSHAHAPYSRFRVGAAVRMEDGSIHAGANVENRSYGLTICAERAALAAAVAAGTREPQAVVVIADSNPPARPCGLCLQALSEFAGPELPVLLRNVAGEQEEFRLGDLLPHPFVLPKRS